MRCFVTVSMIMKYKVYPCCCFSNEQSVYFPLNPQTRYKAFALVNSILKQNKTKPKQTQTFYF